MTQAPPVTSPPPLCRHAQCEKYADGCLVADLAWSERPRLLAVARRRVASAAEAEDVVSEAMTRALECPDVDPARAAAWLTAVTIRLCIDHVREHARAPKRWLYAVQTYPRSDEFEDDVIDTLSAAAIAPLLDDMPAQQRRALQLRADGSSVAAIAAAMSLSEKAVESLLGRARSAARAIVAGLGAGGAFAFGWGRRAESNAAPVAVSTAMAFAMTTIVAAHFDLPRHAAGSPAAGPAHSAVVIADSSWTRSTLASTRNVSAPITAATIAAARRHDRAAVAPSPTVSVSRVQVHDDGAGRVDSNESLSDSLRACVTGGVEISPSYIGCRSGRPHEL